jgi:predicted ArsR family transcriptional regulator
MQEKTWQQQAIELSKFRKQDGSKMSWRQIAKALGVPKTTVQEHLRKHYNMIETVTELESRPAYAVLTCCWKKA